MDYFKLHPKYSSCRSYSKLQRWYLRNIHKMDYCKLYPGRSSYCQYSSLKRWYLEKIFWNRKWFHFRGELSKPIRWIYHKIRLVLEKCAVCHKRHYRVGYLGWDMGQGLMCLGCYGTFKGIKGQ